ncbi:MAG: histidine phosphatase family protein [Algicola sp.]|nr:histidine phosphatase family protein [Algicola sp.]
MSTVIDLLRHGKVDGASALYGSTDILVTRDGFKAMQQSLKVKPEKVFSSPLQRCAKFSQQLTKQAILVDELAEMNFGDWDGVPFDALNDHWDALHQFWQNPGLNPPPNGENLDNFHRRVVKGWQLVTAHGKGQNNLVVCHGGVIRMILAHILNVDYRQGSWYSGLSIDYASLTRIEIPDHPNAQPVIRFINMAAPTTSKTIFKESHD